MFRTCIFVALACFAGPASAVTLTFDGMPESTNSSFYEEKGVDLFGFGIIGGHGKENTLYINDSGSIY